MKTALLVSIAVLWMPAASCAKPTIDAGNLCRHWFQSCEEQGATDLEQIFRPAGFKTFPPSRFRMQYKFGRDGACEWLFLSPDDAHRFESGTWRVDPNDGAVLWITTAGTTAGYRVTALTRDQLRLVRVAPGNGN
jgi:hypothetical protein